MEFAKYVVVFTTFPASRFTPEAVLDWYRLRWQVERVFKRFKSVAQLGHLPKHGSESSKTWLYGKLFAALLTERLIAHASAPFPWGYDFLAPRSPPSRWGEFRHLRNQVWRAIEPDISLQEVLTDWPGISRGF